MRQFLSVIIMGAVTMAVAGESGSDQASRDAERHIARWNPAEEDQYVPPACIRAGPFELEGEWVSGNQWAGSRLLLTRRQDGRFDVAFSTRIFLVDFEESWTLKRTARASSDAVTLNRAVEDLGGIYRRLWPLVVGPYREVALVPTSVLADVRRAYAAAGCVHFKAAFECEDCFVRPRPSRKSAR